MNIHCRGVLTGMSNTIAIGSRVITAKGTEGTIAQVLDGGYLLNTGKRVRIESIALVIAPPPDRIQVGDYLKRRFKEPVQYPAALLGNDSQRNALVVYPIRKAVVEGLSNDGYWVRSIDDDEIFHVPITAIEDGVWEFKAFSDGLNLPPPNDLNTSPVHEDRPVPPILNTLDGFTIGDRVTMMDDYHVRAADTGTVEVITEIGIQVLWDNNSPHEKLKQPPTMGRTFDSHELKRID
jgi:hypothetical protein